MRSEEEIRDKIAEIQKKVEKLENEAKKQGLTLNKLYIPPNELAHTGRWIIEALKWVLGERDIL